MSSSRKKARLSTSSPTSEQSRGPHRKLEYKVCFGHVSNTEAAQGYDAPSSRDQSTLSARGLASEIPMDELWLTDAQKHSIRALHKENCIVDHVFSINQHGSQTQAAALMASHGLDIASREDPVNRWSARWTSASQQVGVAQTKRVLYQWCVIFLSFPYDEAKYDCI